MDTYVDTMGYRWGITIDYFPDKREHVISVVVTKPGSSRALQWTTAIPPEKLEAYFAPGATEDYAILETILYGYNEPQDTSNETP